MDLPKNFLPHSLSLSPTLLTNFKFFLILFTNICRYRWKYMKLWVRISTSWVSDSRGSRHSLFLELCLYRLRDPTFFGRFLIEEIFFKEVG